MIYASPKNVSTEATKGLQLGIWGFVVKGLLHCRTAGASFGGQYQLEVPSTTIYQHPKPQTLNPRP